MLAAASAEFSAPPTRLQQATSLVKSGAAEPASSATPPCLLASFGSQACSSVGILTSAILAKEMFLSEACGATCVNAWDQKTCEQAARCSGPGRDMASRVSFANFRVWASTFAASVQQALGTEPPQPGKKCFDCLVVQVPYQRWIRGSAADFWVFFGAVSRPQRPLEAGPGAAGCLPSVLNFVCAVASLSILLNQDLSAKFSTHYPCEKEVNSPHEGQDLVAVVALHHSSLKNDRVI